MAIERRRLRFLLTAHPTHLHAHTPTPSIPTQAYTHRLTHTDTLNATRFQSPSAAVSNRWTFRALFSFFLLIWRNTRRKEGCRPSIKDAVRKILERSTTKQIGPVVVGWKISTESYLSGAGCCVAIGSIAAPTPKDDRVLITGTCNSIEFSFWAYKILTLLRKGKGIH